ncbi:hypothetical protein C7S18_16765 [Ahniella affigens]|uniref:Secreted protein n=1 Tax=Ahniella affigens TaxID=2021234 RepID=A0A2P1PV67_9GAMM|nr:hypothetical protein [Ahniella affigens]AVP98739.1 hypothetical protein C7S18_16765 [Ahniella affigens]
MNAYRTALTLFVLTTGLLMTDAHAGKKSKNAPVIPPATNAAEFEKLAADIRGGLTGGGRFEYVPASQERTLRDQLDVIASLLAKGDPKALDDADKVALFNAQEQVNGILTEYDGNRLICQSRSRTGSNRRETVCQTYAELRAARDAAERMIRDANNQQLPKGG